MPNQEKDDVYVAPKPPPKPPRKPKSKKKKKPVSLRPADRALAQRAAIAAAARRRARRLARERAAAQARERARARAADIAKQTAARERARARDRARAVARRQATDELQRRQRDLLRKSGLIRDERETESQAIQREKRTRRKLAPEVARKAAVRVAASEAEAKKRRDAYLAREWQSREHAWRKGQVISGRSKNPRDAERILAEEARRAKAGLNPDYASTEKVMERLIEYAEGVSAKYKKKVDDLVDALESGNRNRAVRLWNDPEFQKLHKEWQRLMGTGMDARKDGAIAEANALYEGIKKHQVDWWKSQMQEALNADKAAVREEYVAAARRGDTKAAKQYQDLMEVYEGKTRWVVENGKRRRLTIEEELEKRAAEGKVEMARLRHQYEQGRFRENRFNRQAGLVPTPDGRWVTPSERNVEFWHRQVIDEKYGGEHPDLRRPEDVHKLADEIIRRWEERARREFGLEGVAVHRYADSDDLRRNRSFLAAKKSFEAQVYASLGSGVPQWWDRAFALPVASHALAVLQGATATIGAGGRLILQSATGSSQGNLVANVSDLPKYMRDEIEKASLGLSGDIGKDLAQLGQGGMGAGAKAQQGRANQLLNDWLQTADGKRWLKEWMDKERARVAGENQAFTEGWFSGDIGRQLDALNQFGTRPFRDDAQNLMFQLLVDPTNAIPLKFTTWLARGKFAAENAGKTKFLGSTKFGRVRDFAAVDEGVLGVRRELDKVLRKAGKDGEDIRRVTEDLLSELAGIKDPSDLAKALEDKLRALGVDTRKVNSAELLSLTEEAIKRRLKRSGIDYASQFDEVKRRVEAVEAEKKIAAEKRRARAVRREARLKRGKQVRVEQGRQARGRLAQRQAAEASKPVSKPKPAAVAAPKPKPKPRDEASTPGPAEPVRRKVTEKVAAEARARMPKHEERYAPVDEYYTTKAGGGFLPHARPEVRRSPYYRGLLKAARNGEDGAVERLRRYERRVYNRFVMEEEDIARSAKFQQTDYDFAARGGVADDAKARADLEADRQQVEYLKGRIAQDGGGEFLNEQVLRGERIRREAMDVVDVHDAALAEQAEAAVVYVGSDLRAATSVSKKERRTTFRENTGRRLPKNFDEAVGPSGIAHTYEPFSGHHREAYRGGIYERVRDPRWLKRLDKKKLLTLLVDLDNEALGAGIAGFRDGGQAVFEIFHGLRLSGDLKKLRELSKIVDAYLEKNPESLFAAQWKVMEYRAGFGWSLDAADVEAIFIYAAQEWGIHPRLSLTMIPNGYYGHPAQYRFGFSSALKALEEAPASIARVAPAGWTESKALQAINHIFGFLGKSDGFNATRVIHYAARRHGGFSNAGFRLRNRLLDHGIYAAALNDPDALVEAMYHSGQLTQEYAQLAHRLGLDVRTAMRKDIESVIRQVQAKGNWKAPDFRVGEGVLRDAFNQAYWSGKVTFPHAEGHELMYYAALQENPRAWKSISHSFLDHMEEIGEGERGNRLIRELFSDDSQRYITRSVEGDVFDAERGVVGVFRDTEEARLWRRVGVSTDIERAKAYLDSRQRGEQVALDGSDARKLREVGQYDNEEDLLRDMAGRHERDAENPTAFAGGEREDWLAGYLQHQIQEWQRLINEEDWKGAEYALQQAANVLMRTVRRVIEHGAVGDEFDMLRDAERVLAAHPEGKMIVHRLRYIAGDELTARWLNLSGNLPQYRGKVEVKPLPAPLPERPKSPDPEFRAPTAEEMAAQAVGGSKNRPAAPEVSPEPVVPTETVHISEAEGLLRTIGQMSEEEYWDFISKRSWKILNSKTASAASKLKARRILQDVKSARYAKKQASVSGGYIPIDERLRFRSHIVDTFGKEAEELVAPNKIAPYVDDAVGLDVEEGRTYWRLLRSRSHIEHATNARVLNKAGEEVDHLPRNVWRRLHAEMTEAIREHRGWQAKTRTRSRRAGFAEESRFGRMQDRDSSILAVKQRVLREFRDKTGWDVNMRAYDEARTVLWKGTVQRGSAQWLMDTANDIVARWGGDYTDIYKRLRDREARAEARRQLGRLAFNEMYGHEPDAIMAEFTARYTDDGQLRDWHPELTSFGRRTLEEHVKKLSGVADIRDEASIGTFLRSRNAPPFNDRGKMRDFLVHIGAWAPRTADDFTLGARSWDIDEQARYWRDSYGFVPVWADRTALQSEDLAVMFHDQGLYFDQHRKWGTFNRMAEAMLRITGDMTEEEIEKAIIHGNKDLGLLPRRELELQRKYFIETYKDLVWDGERMTAIPWLMYPEERLRYAAQRTAAGLGVADDLAQDVGEVLEIQQLIEGAISEFWEKYFGTVTGPVQYEDVFRMASEVQARLLADPKWARRWRDRLVGMPLNGWSTFNRALVMTQLSFMAMNVVDTPIKGAWYRFSRRGLFDVGTENLPDELAERVRNFGLADFGLQLQTTLYRASSRKATEYLTKPVHRGLRGALERATFLPRAFYRAFPAGAAHVEMAGKLRLAKGMYPTVYSEALTRLKDPDLADAFARNFIRKEVSRMWPTAGDGPLERLFNQLVPFASYMVKNKVLFLSEAVQHPSVLNWIDYIGRYIEQENVRAWAESHPGETLPTQFRRRIALPWAPDYFIDLGQFSDATRGLKPFYKAAEPQSYLDAVSQWVRIVNPSTQAGIYMLTNALGVTKRLQWKGVYDEDGFLTGYEPVITGWTEPWSKDQPTPSSVFWFLDALEQFKKLGAGGWTNGEMSQILGKVAFFDAIQTPDRGSALFELYKAMRDKNKEAAEKWLEATEDGRFLQDWLLSKQDDPKAIADFFALRERALVDPKRWFHSQTKEFQDAVKDGLDKLDAIERAYKAKLQFLTPGTAEYAALKAEMRFYLSEVYRLTPELTIHQVLSKTAAEWSQQLLRWETDQKVDEFFALDKLRPTRADYKTSAAYQKALDAWRHQKEVFLKTYPQVEAALGGARDAYSQLREQVEAEWDAILKRIGQRSDLIDAAKERGDQEKADLLYLAQELDFSLLERDFVVQHFDETDFEPAARGIGPLRLKPNAMKGITALLDFDRRRYEKAVREGREQEFLDDQFFANGMKEVILKAKGGDPLGEFDPAVFVAEMKKRPRLRSLYFKKNPGKQQEWEKNEEYIRLIKPWGQAAAAGQWDRAQRIWDGLPQWVKDRYYSKHPERRRRAAANAAYIGYLQQWVSHFERGDVGGGMDFFWSMPKWVRERYFAKHPEKRAKWEAQMQMGSLLDKYFDTPRDKQAAFLKAHPELKKLLVRAVGKQEADRQSVLAEYQAIPKDEAFARKAYREAHPEVFSKEAQGERRVKKVYDRLAAHPEMLPDFEAWVKAIWDSYTEMLRHMDKPPKPIESERDVPARKRRRGRSAEETSKAA